MTKFYLLDENKVPYEVPLTESYKLYEHPEMKITKQDFVEKVFVSTVFLGMTLSYDNDGKPLLWETMIFGGPHNEYQVRYSSHQDALIGHQKAINLLTNPVEEFTD